MSERRRAVGCEEAGSRGLGGFLRSLLAGIPWRERAEATETLRLPYPDSSALRVDNPNGRTRVVGEDREDLEVRVLKCARAESEAAARRLVEAIRLATEDNGSALLLEVEVPRRWNRRGQVNLELHVPRTLSVDVAASNGKVCIAGLRAATRARSSNGAVRVDDVIGDVEIYTSNAKVSCSGNAGRLVARSSNGKVSVEGHSGSVDASTSNGLIHATLEEVGPEGVRLATSNGRIVLVLPEKIDADVDLRVDNGIIRNQRSLHRCTRSSGGRLVGTLGKGGVPVRLRTSNGSISLR